MQGLSNSCLLQNLKILPKCEFWPLKSSPNGRISLDCFVLRHAYFLPDTSSGLQVLSLFAPVCACVYVCQPRAYQCYNSSPIQARITKVGQRCKTPWVKILIVLGVDWSWPSSSNLTRKSKCGSMPLDYIINYQRKYIMVMRQLHVPGPPNSPDCFTVSILCTHLST